VITGAFQDWGQSILPKIEAAEFNFDPPNPEMTYAVLTQKDPSYAGE
jgi:hypothetical protein